LTLENGAIFCAFPSKVFLAEMNRNLGAIPHALSTWMILEIWELIGCVVGMPKMAHTSVLIHLGFRLWEKEMSVHGKKHFFRNTNQIQWEQSVRCGYYCLVFLNERNKGTSFTNILKMFTDDVLQNERIVKNYFS